MSILIPVGVAALLLAAYLLRRALSKKPEMAQTLI
jgi:hypothetical protein